MQRCAEGISLSDLLEVSMRTWKAEFELSSVLPMFELPVRLLRPDTSILTKEIRVLERRPGCECCDTDLPPDSDQALICSFECTLRGHETGVHLPESRR